MVHWPIKWAVVRILFCKLLSARLLTSSSDKLLLAATTEKAHFAKLVSNFVMSQKPQPIETTPSNEKPASGATMKSSEGPEWKRDGKRVVGKLAVTVTKECHQRRHLTKERFAQNRVHTTHNINCNETVAFACKAGKPQVGVLVMVLVCWRNSTRPAQCWACKARTCLRLGSVALKAHVCNTSFLPRRYDLRANPIKR